MSTRDQFKLRLLESETPTSWMKFYTLWLLPITIVINCIYVLVYVVRSVVQIRTHGFEAGAIFALAMLAFSMVMLFLMVFTYYYAIRLLPRGFKLLIALFVVDIVIRIVFLIVASQISVARHPSSQVADWLGVGVAVGNLIYFAKRKHLFRPMDQTSLYAE